MSKFIKVESEGLSFEVFASARVPLLYQKKFGIGILKDAENLLMDAEKSTFLVYQCYLAKCRTFDEKPQFSEDHILDNLPAVDVLKTSYSLINMFSNEVSSLTEDSKGEKKT